MAGKLLLTAMFLDLECASHIGTNWGIGMPRGRWNKPQEVCIEDHVFLGGTPTIPPPSQAKCPPSNGRWCRLTST